MLLKAGSRVHFIGIGGAGVSGLARMALALGARVSGTDLRASPVTDALAALGAEIETAPTGTRLVDLADTVIATAAVRSEHPEHRAATRRGLKVWKYAQALGALTRRRANLCVCGTHGKTSTTSMLAHILREQGIDAGWIIGGDPANLPASAHLGRSRLFVAESCEYDRSFMNLSPTVVVLNNIEADHLDCFGDIDGVERAFAEFVAKLPPWGLLVFNHDDERCRRVAARAPCEALSFGREFGADWRVTNIDDSTGFVHADVVFRCLPLGRLDLGVPGGVYAHNALAALVASAFAGARTREALATLATFRGVKRRFEVLGRPQGVPIVDDYAHHPTAVDQLLAAARKAFAGRRIVAVFQAHQMRRITGMFHDFARALSRADRVHIARTYAARETGVVPGAVEQRMVEDLARRGVSAASHESFDAIAASLARETRPDDALIFIGAGDINEVALGLLRSGELERALAPLEAAA